MFCRPKDGYYDMKERKIHCNDVERNKIYEKYTNNTISTTQYTVITFLPKNLFQQFQKAANFYFLVLAVYAFIYLFIYFFFICLFLIFDF